MLYHYIYHVKYFINYDVFIILNTWLIMAVARDSLIDQVVK